MVVLYYDEIDGTTVNEEDVMRKDNPHPCLEPREYRTTSKRDQNPYKSQARHKQTALG